MLHSLVKSLSKALEELHQQEWAHLDIRLDNICLSKGNEVLLIDLDRAMMTNKKSSAASSLYGPVPMYTWPDHNNSRLVSYLDYRQMGLMIYYLRHQDEISKYHVSEPQGDMDDFVKKLLQEGECDFSLH